MKKSSRMIREMNMAFGRCILDFLAVLRLGFVQEHSPA